MSLLLAAFFAVIAPSVGEGPQTVYANARVWDGAGFARRTLVVEDGEFVGPQMARADATVIDLAGKFISPAYANGHVHVTPPTAPASQSYTNAGVFYAWNPNTVVIDAERRRVFGRPGIYRVKIAQGGITEPGGHPERIYVDVLGPDVYEGRPLEWFVGNAFHYVEEAGDIERVLSKLQDQGADFVKIYLLYSEQYDALRQDPASYGHRGLNPALVPALVEEAHARGMQVVAHIETANDLQVAAEAKVDFAAHLPGYSQIGLATPEALRITSALADVVAQSGMRVMATYSLADDSEGRPADRSAEGELVRQIQTANLRALREAGVPILMGTDGRNQIFSEAEHLVHANDLADRDVAALVFATGKTLFPELNIGCFDPGCTADFLVLDGDPTRDIRNLRKISRRIMGGIDLPGPAQEEPSSVSEAAAAPSGSASPSVSVGGF